MNRLYNCYIVYGWEESDPTVAIDADWLFQHYGYCVRGISTSGNAVCGIICEFNKHTGKACIGDEDRQMIEELYIKVKNYKQKKISLLEFYTCIINDICLNNREEYIPED